MVSLAEPGRRRCPGITRLEGESMTPQEDTFPGREFNDEEKSALATILAIQNQDYLLGYLHDGLHRESES